MRPRTAATSDALIVTVFVNLLLMELFLLIVASRLKHLSRAFMTYKLRQLLAIMKNVMYAVQWFRRLFKKHLWIICSAVLCYVAANVKKEMFVFVRKQTSHSSLVDCEVTSWFSTLYVLWDRSDNEVAELYHTSLQSRTLNTRVLTSIRNPAVNTSNLYLVTKNHRKISSSFDFDSFILWSLGFFCENSLSKIRIFSALLFLIKFLSNSTSFTYIREVHIAKIEWYCIYRNLEKYFEGKKSSHWFSCLGLFQLFIKHQ